MDDVAAHAQTAPVEESAHAFTEQAERAHEHAELAPAAAAPEPAEAERAPAAKPEPYRITLHDFCVAKSKKLLGHVELVSAFAAVEGAKHHQLDTPDNFEKAFAAFRVQPA